MLSNASNPLNCMEQQQANSIIDVSIVIVCMNKPDLLCVCLDSIREQTHQVSYEVLVVAYLFSADNLSMIRQAYPWVQFIESNEIRGFSENNNLALRQARGRYCFVVNDDTKLTTSVLDQLVNTFEHRVSERVAIVSPILLDANGKVQICGVKPKTYRDAVLECFRLWKYHSPSPYTNQPGLFRSYNIIGAAFMIRTDIFKALGWFDERFFFCPEDIALSTLVNQKGYECWVDNEARLIHYEGLSSHSLSRIQTATKPAATRGTLIYFGTTTPRRWLLSLATVFYYMPKVIVFGIKYFFKKSEQDGIKVTSAWHAICAAFSRRSPKEIFIHYYTKLNNHA